MQSPIPYDLSAAAADSDARHVAEPESDLLKPDLLRDVLRMLPSGVTVQDEYGRLLLVNDDAAAQLGISATDPALPPSPQLNQRREAALDVLCAGQMTVIEECI